jgi:hypothetical protein
MLNDFCAIAERLAVSSLDISENAGTIHEFYSKNVGTIHELSLPTVSVFLKTIVPFLYISVNPPVAIHGLPTCH